MPDTLHWFKAGAEGDVISEFQPKVQMKHMFSQIKI